MDRYELLAAARSELRRMTDEQRGRAYDPPEGSASVAREAAYIEARADAADGAIFDLLNVMANYGEDEQAREILHVTDAPIPA